MNIRAEINETENRENKLKPRSFEEIDTSNYPLDRLIQGRKRKGTNSQHQDEGMVLGLITNQNQNDIFLYTY